jgi:NADH dehydrogenase [ubiquinone] 1 alpha subcomplex assembly factor 7
MNPNIKYFKKSRKIPLDEFFEDVLYNTKYGYYTTQNPFEKSGDFITAPSISRLFGEMIALNIVSYWEVLGKPNNFNIVELGPGNGKLMKYLVETFKQFSQFYESSTFILYEKSKLLRDVQKKNLSSNKIKWIFNLNQIKKGPIFFLGNEFFDAIPIKQFVRKKKNLYENYVYLDQHNDIKKILIKSTLSHKKKIDKSLLLRKAKFLEYPKLGFDILDTIIEKIRNSEGALLLIDYGYIKQNGLDTLQSVKKHKKNNLFNNLGKADITSLVNFGLIKEYLVKNKLNVKNIVTQSFFLKKMGILNRAEILSLKMNFKQKSDLHARIKRLLHPNFMGEIFKVLFAYKSKDKNIIGFD